jgi:Mrp family chromosome partitioning ATPase
MNNNSTLGALRRRWWVIVLFALVGAVVGAIPEPQRVEEQLRTFTATHTLLMNDDDSSSNNNNIESVISPSQVTLFVSTGEVPRRAAEALDFGGNAATLASQVSSDFDFSSGALTITTTQEEARRAEVVADTFADELNSFLAERQDAVYQDRLAAALQRLADLEIDLNEVTFALAANPESPTLAAQQSAVSRQYSVAFERAEELSVNPPVLGFTTIQRAEAVEVTDRGISAPTGRTSRAILGMLVGAALGAGVALLLGQLDRRLRTREQAESVMDMRARVTIPKVRDSDRDQIVVATGRHDPLSDSYRTVRNVVGFVTPDNTDTAPITLVVSPGPGDGKTSLAANLAASMAETGKRTILINTDFRRPRLATVLGPAAVVPLPFTLDDLERLDARSVLNKTDRSNLLLMDLSTIDGSPGELLRATIDKLPELKTIADAIVIDTSPVGVTAEALDLVPFADVIAVIARVGGTQIAVAQRTMAILRDLATAPMVLVLSGIKMEKADYYEYTDRKRRDRPARVPRRERRAKPAGTEAPTRIAVADPIDAYEPAETRRTATSSGPIDDTGVLFATDDLLDADGLFQFDDEIQRRGARKSDEPAGVRSPDVEPSG